MATNKCNTIKAFTLDLCQPNLGGIKNIWLADWEADVATLDSTEDATVAEKLIDGKITALKESVVWTHYPMRKNTCSMTSTLNNSTEGASYVTTELAMVFSKMETQKRIAIQALAIGQVMAVVEDSNGERWFLGKDEPLTATAGTGETGTAKADSNRYSLTLTDESLGFPYPLAKEIQLTPKTEEA